MNRRGQKKKKLSLLCIGEVSTSICTHSMCIHVEHLSRMTQGIFSSSQVSYETKQILQMLSSFPFYLDSSSLHCFPLFLVCSFCFLLVEVSFFSRLPSSCFLFFSFCFFSLACIFFFSFSEFPLFCCNFSRFF